MKLSIIHRMTINVISSSLQAHFGVFRNNYVSLTDNIIHTCLNGIQCSYTVATKAINTAAIKSSSKTVGIVRARMQNIWKQFEHILARPIYHSAVVLVSFARSANRRCTVPAARPSRVSCRKSAWSRSAKSWTCKWFFTSWIQLNETTKTKSE